MSKAFMKEEDAAFVLPPTKSAFVERYRQMLVQQYAWAHDEQKLDVFMAVVKGTLDSVPGRNWNHDGPAVTAAWRAIGGKGKPSLRALRALP